jgi:hypothetical protein
MRFPIAVALASVVTAQSLAQPALDQRLTVGQVVSECRGTNPEQTDFCLKYIAFLLDVTKVANSRYCPGSLSEEMRGLLAFQMLIAIRRSPDTDRQATGVVEDELVRLYPCK